MKNHYSEYQYSKENQRIELCILKYYGMGVLFITLLYIIIGVYQ